MEFLALLFPHSYNILFYILWLGGIVYAVINRQKHPRTSLFAGIAFGTLFLENLLSVLLTVYIQYQAFTGDGSTTQIGTRLAIVSLCSIPFSIAGWILLLMAIFGQRNIAERESANNHADPDILL